MSRYSCSSTALHSMALGTWHLEPGTWRLIRTDPLGLEPPKATPYMRASLLKSSVFYIYIYIYIL